MRAAMSTPSSSRRQARWVASVGAGSSSSSPCLIRLRNTALRAAAGNLAGGSASWSWRLAALLSRSLAVSESAIGILLGTVPADRVPATPPSPAGAETERGVGCVRS